MNGPQVAKQTWEAAQLWLKEKWSPEQISGRFKLLSIGNISHETIYQRLLQDKKTVVCFIPIFVVKKNVKSAMEADETDEDK